jgi:tRNA pseudouridine38-40 synthase
MRYFFEIAYNGKNYKGWQSQHNAIGVQTVVEDVFGKLLRQKIEIVGSGRTDTGVHCEQQFFHCDIDSEFNAKNFLHRLNVFLPKDIFIRSVKKVTPEASARFDAVERTYRYEITRIKNPFLDGLAWHFFKPVNIQTMNTAAALLTGEHDYECFSKVNTDVRHFLSDIKNAAWKEEGEKLIFTITANRFLRGMVRAVVGTLLEVGTGKITISDYQEIIRSKDRKKAGANVPAHGLYLMGVKYRPEIFIK